MFKIHKFYTDIGIMFQQRHYSCGAVAVGNAYFLITGNTLTEEELLQYVQTSQTIGSENHDIVSGIQKLGMSISVEKENATIYEIESELEKGNIVLVNYYNTFDRVGHYSIIIEQEEEFFYFFDSIHGIFRLNKKRFDDIWHNGNKSIYRWMLGLRGE